jgi:hypothetical protein
MARHQRNPAESPRETGFGETTSRVREDCFGESYSSMEQYLATARIVHFVTIEISVLPHPQHPSSLHYQRCFAGCFNRPTLTKMTKLEDAQVMLATQKDHHNPHSTSSVRPHPLDWRPSRHDKAPVNDPFTPRFRGGRSWRLMQAKALIWEPGRRVRPPRSPPPISQDR